MIPCTRGLLVILVLLAALLGLGQPGAAQVDEIRSEGFEGTFPNANWFVLDYESDSGADYWGPSSVLAIEGTRSAWSAQVGTHSVLGGSNSATGQYDNDQLASMELKTGDLSGYQSVTLSFWYFLLTEETFDYFAVAIGTSEADVPANSEERFRDSIVADWTRKEISIPTDTRLILFMFVSDFSVFGLGGVFVDDVSLVGELPPAGIDLLPILIGVAVVAAGAIVAVLLWRRRASVSKGGEPTQPPAPAREPPVGPSTPGEAPPPEASGPGTPETLVCPSCGATNPGDLVACLDCGAKLT